MKKTFTTVILLAFCCAFFTGCDPVLPKENITANYSPKPLTLGVSAHIEIIYPDTEGTSIVEWTDQSVEIVQGKDIVEVSGLTMTGLKPGTARLKIEVKANCSFMGIIIDRPTFSAELEVIVE